MRALELKAPATCKRRGSSSPGAKQPRFGVWLAATAGSTEMPRPAERAEVAPGDSAIAADNPSTKVETEAAGPVDKTVGLRSELVSHTFVRQTLPTSPRSVVYIQPRGQAKRPVIPDAAAHGRQVGRWRRCETEGKSMTVKPEVDETPNDERGVGRFLRGEIIERFLSGKKDRRSEAGLSLAAVPLTVTLTDTVREITDTIPQGRDFIEGVGSAITAYTTTIPAITRTLTENITRVP